MRSIKWCFCWVALLAMLAGQAATPANAKTPRRVGSTSKLLRLLRGTTPAYSFAPQRSSAPSLEMDNALAPSYSGTNVQVTGVDEGDVVKTDGQMIYQLNAGRVLAISAYPTDQLAFTELKLPSDSFWPLALYLADGWLTVIGSAWVGDDSTDARWFRGSLTMACVYDVRDPGNPVLTRQVKVEGDYLSSRRVGSYLYVLARRYPLYTWRGARAQVTATGAVPRLSDTAVRRGRARAMSIGEIYYFPEMVEPDYLMIASFALDRPHEPARVEAFLGAGEVVYASPDSLYVSVANRAEVWIMRPMLVAARATADAAFPEETSAICKFALSKGKVTFVARGEVPGTVLNQFAMDEHEDYFRVATVRHGWWTGTETTTGVYVLDAEMQAVGAVEKLAPGEELYAARFVGARCYLVTFRNVDPLFVLDLSVPSAPKVAGELVIPGYSNYLQPYDENHLIGFGKDVVVVEDTDDGDELTWPGAFYQGLKIALFDVTDISAPRELHTLKIGDRGTDSPVLWDHQSLLFERDRNLLAFPVTIAQLPETFVAPNPWDYGEIVFQGALVYDLSLENGFVLRGKVTHLEDAPTDDYWGGDWNRYISRLVRIEQAFYSLSAGLLKVNDLKTFEELGRLELQAPWEPEPWPEDPDLGVVNR